MRKYVTLCLALVIAFSPVCLVFAQDDKPDSSTAKSAAPAEDNHFYHLEFAVKEIDGNGKVINSRSYSTICASNKPGRTGSIRTGSRVPIYTGEKNQIQYIDLGVNIDIMRAHVVANDLAMELSVEVSSAADSPNPEAHPTPIIRQNRWESSLVVPLNKPVIIFSSDDLNSKGKIQLEVTAVFIK